MVAAFLDLTVSGAQQHGLKRRWDKVLGQRAGQLPPRTESPSAACLTATKAPDIVLWAEK